MPNLAKRIFDIKRDAVETDGAGTPIVVNIPIPASSITVFEVKTSVKLASFTGTGRIWIRTGAVIENTGLTILSNTDILSAGTLFGVTFTITVSGSNLVLTFTDDGINAAVFQYAIVLQTN